MTSENKEVKDRVEEMRKLFGSEKKVGNIGTIKMRIMGVAGDYSIKRAILAACKELKVNST
jgi:hypothetical protein